MSSNASAPRPHEQTAERRPPSVERLLGHDAAAALSETFGRTAVRDAIREDLAAMRAR